MRPIHNNPLNIRKSNDTFLGEYVSDLPFKEFDTMDHGIRAAMVIIRNYVLLHKCKNQVPKIHLLLLSAFGLCLRLHT